MITLNRPAVLAAVRDTAREEPATVAQARALIADPVAACRENVAERLMAWLVALEAHQQRQGIAPHTGGTAA